MKQRYPKKKKTVRKQRTAVAFRVARKKVAKKRNKQARTLPIPKRAGFLPLVFAGLAALGSLIGGASAVAKAVNASKEAKQQLKENMRHNQVLEAIALGGKGLRKNKRSKNGF